MFKNALGRLEISEKLDLHFITFNNIFSHLETVF